MPRCIGGFIEKLRHKSHEDSLVGHAVRLLVLLLNQPVFQLIVTVAVPVWLTFYDTGSLNRIRKLILCIGYTAIIIAIAAVNLLKSQAPIKKSYRQKKSIAKQRRQNGSLGRLK